METYEVPCWMTALMSERGVFESDYYLYGAGRALGFVKTAAGALDQLENDLKEAEYHAYAGISAARTAIDAVACWLNLALEIDQVHNSALNLSRKDFRKKVVAKVPAICWILNHLCELGSTIDEHRQRAQHREGLPLKYHIESTALDHAKGWYLVTAESLKDHQLDLRLCNVLQEWQRHIEENLFLIHHELVCPALSAEEAERVKEIRRTLESIGAWTAPVKTSCPYHS